ncbi:MAG: hypothetical protein RLZZ385_2116 [Pseudomonadota bacterium]|jgi:glycosyltransferase involved in cell wall biosynthesis
MSSSATIPVSVFVITKDEAANLPRLLDNVRDFAEVIVVDSGSSDATVEIASSYANTRVSFNPWPGFGKQKAHALGLCSYPWVLNLDADETLSDLLREEIRDVIRRDDVAALQCRRQLLRWGRPPRCFDKPDRLIRLFRKTCGRYDDRMVHESITVDGPVRQSGNLILHHENLGIDQRLQKSIFYARLKAQDKFDKGQHTHPLVPLLIAPLTFLKMLLIRGHLLDGFAGILTSSNAAFYSFMKYAILWEMWRRKGNK